LSEVLIIAILAIICGAQWFTQMEIFGREKREWLSTFLKLEHGIPSHDTFGDVFAALDAEAVVQAYASWVETIRTKISGEVIAIDGKTVCASKDVPKNKKAVHIVSAWATQNRLVLGQLAAGKKSNEITAIPELLNLLEIKGCIITIDAMGTQKKIAETIIDKGADYILTVKENQPNLHSNIKEYFENTSLPNLEQAETQEKSHGRIELRNLTISRDISGIDPDSNWKNMSGIGMLESFRENLSTGKMESSVQYLIFSSPEATAEQILDSKRAHWGIENNLHWVLDVAYNEDNSRARAGNAAIIFNVFRHMSLNLVNQEKSSKGGVKSKQFRCAISTDYLLKVLGIS
jgi:predicted transposase YbfD/YdcC